MSKGVFANPKAALAFAGATLGIAVLASFGAGSFVPETQANGRVDVPPEIEAIQAQDAAAKRAAREEREDEEQLTWDGKKRSNDWEASEGGWEEVGDGWGRDVED